MPQLKPFCQEDETPGVFDNRKEACDEDENYVVRLNNLTLIPCRTRDRAREVWRKELANPTQRPPPRRKPRTPPKHRVGGRKRPPLKIKTAPRKKDKGRAQSVTPSELEVLRPHLEAAAKSKCSSRQKKLVCGRCGAVLRAACTKHPTGAIVHRSKWDQKRRKLVRCGGRFILVDRIDSPSASVS